jgi:oligopeptide/dipeptide ABC transporter ATP-binding protein
VVIADEPLSALDVSIQAQVLNLMIRLQEERGLTYLFVTHDLDVARHISQRTAVLYLGRVVEEAPTAEIFAEPLHPYTQALVRAAPRLTTKRKAAKPALGGELPNAIDRPPGCHFHPRCPMVMPRCREEEPALTVLPGGRTVASVTTDVHGSSRFVLGKPGQIVAVDFGAEPVQVPFFNRLHNGPVPVHRLGQVNALVFYRRPHHRAHLAVEHAPQVFQPAPPGKVDEQFMKAGVALD